MIGPILGLLMTPSTVDSKIRFYNGQLLKLLWLGLGGVLCLGLSMFMRYPDSVYACTIGGTFVGMSLILAISDYRERRKWVKLANAGYRYTKIVDLEKRGILVNENETP